MKRHFIHGSRTPASQGSRHCSLHETIAQYDELRSRLFVFDFKVQSEFLVRTGKRDLPESLIAALFTLFGLSSIQLLQHRYAASTIMTMARVFPQDRYMLEYMDSDLL